VYAPNGTQQGINSGYSIKKRTNPGYLRNHTLTQISAGKRKVAYHHKYIPEHEASGRERIDGPLW
jgi:hypothetical protein